MYNYLYFSVYKLILLVCFQKKISQTFLPRPVSFYSVQFPFEVSEYSNRLVSLLRGFGRPGVLQSRNISTDIQSVAAGGL